MKILAAACLAATLATAPAMAAGADVVTIETDVAFADAAQALNDAIINKGYAIDYHGFLGDMLKRTAADVGADKPPYNDAEFFTFCSAVLSRAMMDADIADIAYCPYIVFVYERADTPGTVTLGYRKLPDGAGRDAVNAMLDEVVRGAADGF